MKYTASEFESIYAKCFPSAMRLAVSLLHDEDDARDAVHEAFLRLWESKTEVVNPTAFIVSVVRNICLNRISTLSTRERMLRKLTFEPLDETFDGEDQQDALKKAVDSQTMLRVLSFIIFTFVPTYQIYFAIDYEKGNCLVSIRSNPILQ